MDSLSPELKNQWLLSSGFTVGFNNRLQNGDSNFDLLPSENLHRVLSFFEQAVNQGSIAPRVLLALEDWPLYLPTEMEILMRLRASASELRPLKEAPYHVFSENETGLALEMFALTISFKWKSNLYAAGSGLALHNWEGDYLECYSDPSESFEKLKVLADQFGFVQETQR